MIRRPPRSTHCISSAASDVYKRQDNGPHSEGGHKHEVFDANGPLRGFKRDLYEGGIRVPTIAWWPGVVEPGTTCSEPLAFWDFLPTACELAGVKTPEGLDGFSFVNALSGKPQRSHDYLYWKYGKKEAVRSGQWKLIRTCLLYTSPSPRDKRQSRMPSSA